MFLEALSGSGFPDWLEVLILAAMPISELRGAIPWAILGLNFPWYSAYVIAVIGNLLPVPVILLFLNTIYRVLGKTVFFRRFFNWLFKITERRSGMILKYKRIGLILFVAIPFPVTGAWTGALAAVLLGLKPRAAFWYICLGVLIAGVIVTCLSLLGWVGALIAGIGLSILVFISFGGFKTNSHIS